MWLHFLKRMVSPLEKPLTLFEKVLSLFLGTIYLNYILLNRTMSEPEFQMDFGAGLIIYSSWLGIFLLVLIILQVSQLFSPGKWETAKISFGLTLIGSLIFIDDFYARTFGKHIEKDDLSLIYLALKSGEIHLGLFDGILYGTGFAVISFGLTVIIHFLRILPRMPMEPLTGLKLLMGTGLLAAILPLYLRDFVIDHTASTVNNLKAAIPWESKSNNPDIEVKDLFVESTGYTITRKTEKKQYKALVRNTKSALKLPITAKIKPNIVMVHIEGLRSDMVHKKRMPNLVGNFDEKWLVLPSHFTTGLNTGLGMFGTLSGLNGFYYPYFRKGDIPPFPLSVLKKLGYHSSVFFTKDLSYDRLYPLIFEKIIDETHRSDSSKSILDQEIEMVDSYRDHLIKTKNNGIPRFDYLVMYTTHYTYFYPPEFEVNKPVLHGRFKIRSGKNKKFQEDAQKIKNRYLNSVLFADHQVKKIIDALKETNRWDNTIFLVFGDHGEEFWEKGSFGHTYKFVNQQAQTAAAIHFPTPVETKFQYTSHCDFMPTFFDYMNVNLDVRNFMSGKSLNRFEENMDFCIVGKGTIKDQRNSKFLVVSSGYKMQFRNKGFLRPDWIVDMQDDPIENIDTRLTEKILIQAKFAKSLPDNRRPSKEPNSGHKADLESHYYSLNKQELIDLLMKNSPRKILNGVETGKAGPSQKRVVLARKKFRINSENSRRLHFPFTVPESHHKNKWQIIANITGARDDQGDKGLYSWFVHPNGVDSEKVFLDAKGLSIVHDLAKPGSKMVFVIEDSDTNFSGKSPGNTGKIEILAYPTNDTSSDTLFPDRARDNIKFVGKN